MDMDQVKLLMAQGQSHFNKGNWDAASKDLSKAQSLLEKAVLDTDGKETLVAVLLLKSFAESRRGRYRHALQAAERAIEISRSIGDHEGEIEGMRKLGNVYWLKGDFHKASEHYDAALVKARECGANTLVGKIKIDQGTVLGALQQYDDAGALFLEAAKILKNEKELVEVARALNNLGFMYILQKKYRDALGVLKNAMDISEQVGDARMKGMTAINIAEALVYLGNHKLAADLIGPAIDSMTECDDKVGIASAYRINGMIHSLAKEWPKAETNFRRALAIMKVSGVAEMEALILKDHGRMLIAKGDKERARAKLSEAYSVYKKLGVKDKAQDVQQLLMQTQD